MSAAVLLTLSFAFVMAPQALLAQAQPAPSKAAAPAPDLAQRIPTPEDCAGVFSEPLKNQPAIGTIYNAAGCYAMAGAKDTAFELLGRATDAGFRDPDRMAADADFRNLHGDPRWEPLQEKIRAAEAAYLKTINAELRDLYRQDQAERVNPDPSNREQMNAMLENDRKRRERVRQILEAGGAKAGDDYFHSALIFQHGETAEDYLRARELAQKAFELNPDLGIARWLSAAAHDRWLWKTGQPQHYGTQFKQTPEGVWTMEPIDETAVTDEQRRQLNVPTLAKAKERIELLNKEGLSALTKGNR